MLQRLRQDQIYDSEVGFGALRKTKHRRSRSGTELAAPANVQVTPLLPQLPRRAGGQAATCQTRPFTAATPAPALAALRHDRRGGSSGVDGRWAAMLGTGDSQLLQPAPLPATHRSRPPAAAFQRLRCGHTRDQATPPLLLVVEVVLHRAATASDGRRGQGQGRTRPRCAVFRRLVKGTTALVRDKRHSRVPRPSPILRGPT